MGETGPRFVWVDGALHPASGAHVSVFDRGFQLGDGVFETLRARAGRVAELDAHAVRLRHSADGLGIVLPADVEALLARGIADLLAAEQLDGTDDDASLRVTVSRGRWLSRALLPPADEPLIPTVAIQAWRLAPPAEGAVGGVSVVVSAVRRDPQNPLLALKTTSRAEYVYAALEARRTGADEVVFATVDGHLSEASTANLFLVRRSADGVVELATPSLDCAILAGTTRTWLLRWAERAGLRPVEARLPVDDLRRADEVFLSSSVAGIRPVLAVGGEPVGDGSPGPWTIRARREREAFLVG